MPSVVVHYQEIALKGKNRPWFIGRLLGHIRRATADLDVRSVRSLMGRIEIVTGPGASFEEIKERLQHVFGIANFSEARRTPAELEALGAALLEDLEGHAPASFRIRARRADKRFPLPSPEIERRLGARVQQAFGWRVDLEHPDPTDDSEALPDNEPPPKG